MIRFATAFLVASLMHGSVRADVDSLIRDLGSNDPEVRRLAAKQLSEKGEDAKEAFAALAKALKDDDVYVRRFAVQAIGSIGDKTPGVIPALSGALKDGNKRVVDAAVEALGKVGAAGVKPLTELVKDKNADTMLRVKAVQGVGRAGKAAKEAVPTLMAVVKDGGKRNDASVITLRTEAANALGEIGPEAKEAVKTLEDLNGDKGVRDQGLKRAVQQALRKIQK
jgi:HEAT repeat protein